IRAVQEDQIRTEIFLSLLTEKAVATRRRVGRDNALADAPFARSSNHAPPEPPNRWRERRVEGRSHFTDDAREFVAEDRRRHDHLRVIAAFENFQVRAAG